MNADEGGFTMIELLITIVIMSVVGGTLAAAVVIGLQTTLDTDQRLVEANDGRTLAAAFIPDVQNATSVSTTATGCGGSGTRVQFEWNDGSAVRVAYATRSVSGLVQLVRVRCAGGAPTEQVIVRSLDPTAPITVACTPGASTVSLTARQAFVGPLQVSGSSRTTGACPP